MTSSGDGGASIVPSIRARCALLVVTSPCSPVPRHRRRARWPWLAVIGYAGTWDVGVVLTNLASAVSYFRMAHWWVDAEDLPSYPEDAYRRTWSGITSELRGDPGAVVDRLVDSLNRTLNDGRFQLPAPPPSPEPEDDEEAVATG